LPRFPDFCLVAIFKPEDESKQLELEVEQKKIDIPVFIEELAKYIKKKIN